MGWPQLPPQVSGTNVTLYCQQGLPVLPLARMRVLSRAEIPAGLKNRDWTGRCCSLHIKSRALRPLTRISHEDSCNRLSRGLDGALLAIRAAIWARRQVGRAER